MSSPVLTLAVNVKEPLADESKVRFELFSAALRTFDPSCKKSFTPLPSMSFGVEYPSPSSPEVILPRESTV